MTYHRHGTRSRYDDGCQCERCKAGYKKYWRWRTTWEQGRGDPPLTSGPELRRHAMDLRNKGVSSPVIRRVTGLSVEALGRIYRGERVGEAEALALLALDIEDLDRIPDTVVIKAEGSRRRVDRIAKQEGWTKKRVAQELGYANEMYFHKGITVRKARQIRDLYYRVCGLRCVMCDEPLAFHQPIERCRGRKTWTG